MSRVVVVGGGFGGTACAARLAKQGHQVTLVERLDRLGGAVGFVERDGYRWDAGPRRRRCRPSYATCSASPAGPWSASSSWCRSSRCASTASTDGDGARDAVGQSVGAARGGRRRARCRPRAAVGRPRALLRGHLGRAAAHVPRAALVPRPRRQGRERPAAHALHLAQGRDQAFKDERLREVALLGAPDGRSRPAQRARLDGDVVLRRAELRGLDGARRDGPARRRR